MAILKHIAIKNMDYGEAQRYLLFNMMNIRKSQFLMKMENSFQERNITLTASTAIPSLLIWNVKS